MKPVRTILCIVASLAVSILACGQDAEPARQPTATQREPAATAVSASPGAGVAQPLAPTETFPTQTPPTVGGQDAIPVYELEATWGGDPSNGVRFTSPNGIAIDSSDNVYVTEFRGNRVQKFTPEGVLVTQWGSQGSADGQFQNPTGIAINQEGNAYVFESGNHRVQKFTSDGQWLASWGSQGSG